MSNWVTRCLECYERASAVLITSDRVMLQPCGHSYEGLKVTASVKVTEGEVVAVRIDAIRAGKPDATVTHEERESK